MGTLEFEGEKVIKSFWFIVKGIPVSMNRPPTLIFFMKSVK